MHFPKLLVVVCWWVGAWPTTKTHQGFLEVPNLFDDQIGTSKRQRGTWKKARSSASIQRCNIQLLIQTVKKSKEQLSPIGKALFTWPMHEGFNAMLDFCHGFPTFQKEYIITYMTGSLFWCFGGHMSCINCINCIYHIRLFNVAQ